MNALVIAPNLQLQGTGNKTVPLSFDVFWNSASLYEEKGRSPIFSIGLHTTTKLAFTSPAQKLSLEESDNQSDPDVLAQEIVDDLEAALE